MKNKNILAVALSAGLVLGVAATSHAAEDRDPYIPKEDRVENSNDVPDLNEDGNVDETPISFEDLGLEVSPEIKAQEDAVSDAENANKYLESDEFANKEVDAFNKYADAVIKENKQKAAQNDFDNAGRTQDDIQSEYNVALDDYIEAIKSGNPDEISNAETALSEVSRRLNAATDDVAEKKNYLDDATRESDDAKAASDAARNEVAGFRERARFADVIANLAKENANKVDNTNGIEGSEWVDENAPEKLPEGILGERLPDENLDNTELRITRKVPFGIKYVDNPNMYVGTQNIISMGKYGIARLDKDGNIAEIVKEPVDVVVERGTKVRDNKEKPVKPTPDVTPVDPIIDFTPVNPSPAPVVDPITPVVPIKPVNPVGPTDDEPVVDTTSKEVDDLIKELDDRTEEIQKELEKIDSTITDDNQKPADEDKKPVDDKKPSDEDKKPSNEDDDANAQPSKDKVVVKDIIKEVKEAVRVPAASHNNPKTGVADLSAVAGTLAISMAGIVATRKKND